MLWDLFPEGKRLGGAPTNFCFHAHQLGADAYPASAVGRDALGREILDYLASKEIPCDYIALDDTHPTGTVRVELEQGKPHYEICNHVAWDFIPVSSQLLALAKQTDAMCFGSLAQRGPVSRATIQAFIGAMRPDALKICDVNLRQSFYSREILQSSLERANVIKVSDEELPVLATMFHLGGGVEDQLDALRSMFSLRLVAYTRGAHGSLLVTADKTDNHSGHRAEAIDTVGAGDSFTATLCVGLLKGRPLKEINDHANRVAAFVCSQSGAVPRLPPELIWK